MTTPVPGEVSGLLEAAQGGDDQARERLYRVLTTELRDLVEGRRRREWQGQTPQTSDLLQEVLLRLLRDDVIDKAPNRAYLFGAAATALRRCLVDHARRRLSGKRGGRWKRHLLDELVDRYEVQHLDLLALNEGLERL